MPCPGIEPATSRAQEDAHLTEPPSRAPSHSFKALGVWSAVMMPQEPGWAYDVDKGINQQCGHHGHWGPRAVSPRPPLDGNGGAGRHPFPPQEPAAQERAGARHRQANTDVTTAQPHLLWRPDSAIDELFLFFSFFHPKRTRCISSGFQGPEIRQENTGHAAPQSARRAPSGQAGSAEPWRRRRWEGPRVTVSEPVTLASPRARDQPVTHASETRLTCGSCEDCARDAL